MNTTHAHTAEPATPPLAPFTNGRCTPAAQGVPIDLATMHGAAPST